MSTVRASSSQEGCPLTRLVWRQRSSTQSCQSSSFSLAFAAQGSSRVAGVADAASARLSADLASASAETADASIEQVLEAS